MSTKRITKVARAPLVAFMSCPICTEFFEEATTICDCLHTFCKKCIEGKFSNEDCKSCPVCDKYLGITPEERLRPDHNIQSVRDKIFPRKKTGEDNSECPQSVKLTPPNDTLREEKSSSTSMAITTPNVSAEGLNKTEKRSKSGSKESSSTRESSTSLNGPPKKDKDKVEYVVKPSSSPDSNNKTLKKLVFKICKSSVTQTPKDHQKVARRENVHEKTELWNPLKCLAEAARRSDTSSRKLVSSSAEDSDDYEVTNGESEKTFVSAPASEVSQFDFIDVMRLDRTNMPIWFSMVASKDEEEAARLPQLPSRFLKLKNSKMPVSYIQKYIARKFLLANEDEVVIKFRGEALLPDILLSEVADVWMKSGPASGVIKTKVGESTEEYLMQLTYSRKLTP